MPPSSLPAWGAPLAALRVPAALGSVIYLRVPAVSWSPALPPAQPAPLSGDDRCEELAVGTNAMTGTGTKEGTGCNVYYV